MTTGRPPPRGPPAADHDHGRRIGFHRAPFREHGTSRTPFVKAPGLPQASLELRARLDERRSSRIMRCGGYTRPVREPRRREPARRSREGAAQPGAHRGRGAAPADPEMALEGMSLRKVAAALETGPASLRPRRRPPVAPGAGPRPGARRGRHQRRQATGVARAPEERPRIVRASALREPRPRAARAGRQARTRSRSSTRSWGSWRRAEDGATAAWAVDFRSSFYVTAIAAEQSERQRPIEALRTRRAGHRQGDARRLSPHPCGEGRAVVRRRRGAVLLGDRGAHRRRPPAPSAAARRDQGVARSMRAARPAARSARRPSTRVARCRWASPCAARSLPSARDRDRRSRAYPVTATIGIAAQPSSRRISSATSYPLSPGRPMSRKTTSGASLLAISRASSPLNAT